MYTLIYTLVYTIYNMYVYIYIYIHIHIHIHTYTYIYIYIYIHTHIHTRPRGAARHAPTIDRAVIHVRLVVYGPAYNFQDNSCCMTV